MTLVSDTIFLYPAAVEVSLFLIIILNFESIAYTYTGIVFVATLINAHIVDMET